MKKPKRRVGDQAERKITEGETKSGRDIGEEQCMKNTVVMAVLIDHLDPGADSLTCSENS